MNTRCKSERKFSGHGMDRRSLLASGAALTAGALIAPNTTWAQSAERVRRIGWLSDTAGVRPTFSAALRELGWVEGRNISVETRSTQGQRERSAELAKELVAAQVEVIVAVAPIPIRAAAQATREVPIVMAWWGGSDLVESGVIASYARPGGNVTGVDMLLSALDAKRLDVLRQAVPKATKIAVFAHNAQIFEQERPVVREVARNSGLTLEIDQPGDSPRPRPRHSARAVASGRSGHRVDPRGCNRRRNPGEVEPEPQTLPSTNKHTARARPGRPHNPRACARRQWSVCARRRRCLAHLNPCFGRILNLPFAGREVRHEHVLRSGTAVRRARREPAITPRARRPTNGGSADGASHPPGATRRARAQDRLAQQYGRRAADAQRGHACRGPGPSEKATMRPGRALRTSQHDKLSQVGLASSTAFSKNPQ